MNTELLLDELADDAPEIWESAAIPSEWAQATLEAWGLGGSFRFVRAAGSLAEDAFSHGAGWPFESPR